MELHNRHKYNLDQRGFFTRCVLLTRALGYIAFLCTIVFFTGHFIQWAYAPPIHPWLKCDDLMIGEDLETLLLNKTHLYTCTTVNTRRALPCMCCVRGHCWRGIEIIRNASAFGTYVDRLEDGRVLSRSIPEFMIVSYQPLRSRKQVVKKEDAPLVGDILRARELLHNWPHAGSELDEL